LTSFVYDLKDQQTKEVPPVGSAIRYGYNNRGQVVHKINVATGEVLISYAYDPQGG
jgi:hypothetical protein